MKKLSQLLNKSIKRSFDGSLEMELIRKYENEWSKQGQRFSLKNELEYLYASVLARSIDNKMKLENSYVLVRDELNDFWMNLDYVERKRLVNIDMQKTLEELPSFMDMRNGKEVYVAFLDERFNDIYREELIMLELPTYATLTYKYGPHVTPISQYNYDMFNGTFVPTQCILNKEGKVVLYNSSMKKLYFIEKEEWYSFPIIDDTASNKQVTQELLLPLANALCERNVTQFMDLATSFGLYGTTCKETILRKYNKKSLFF